MPTSHDITLPFDHKPAWPDACILCGYEKPGAVFRFRAGRVGWEQIVTLHWAFGKRPYVEAPACGHCVRTLRRSRLIRALCSWIVILPITLVILYVVDKRLGWFSGPLRPFRKWIAAGVILVALVPYVAWELFHPPCIDATARGKKIDYEFADPDYAERFAELNDQHVIW